MKPFKQAFTAPGSMRGVTLIELMIVIVVLGILIAVAYPNYLEFTARAKRNEAKAALLQIATNQERHYLNNQVYTTDMTLLGFAASPATTETGSYEIEVTAADAAGYTAQATYQLSGSETTKCNVFSINGIGTKASTPYTDCWTRTR